MTAYIELIFDADCPNSDAARTVLRQACEQAGIEPQWQEWDRAQADSPPHTANYGSPTILVDGVDVAGADTASDAKSCRVYRTADGGLAQYRSLNDLDGIDWELGGLRPVVMLLALRRIATDGAFQDSGIRAKAQGVSFLQHFGNGFCQQGRPATGGKSSRAWRACAGRRAGRW